MILDQFKLDGKVAVVTGAARGLGQGIALGLAEAGADLVAVDVLGTEDTVAKVRALGRRAVGVAANLMGTDDIPRILATAVRELGGVDILVNNAGIIRRAPLLEFSEKDWDDVINLNQRTLFFLSQAVARQMVAQGRGGKIINIASMLSFQGGIRVPSYTASKSGLAGITKLLACEWAGKGVNVNAIAPGYMSTDNTESLRADPKRNAQILDRIPAGRWGESSDMGGAAVFLASSASDYVHGAIIPVDGGWLAR